MSMQEWRNALKAKAAETLVLILCHSSPHTHFLYSDPLFNTEGALAAHRGGQVSFPSNAG